MKRKFALDKHDNEIDLIDLLKIIWSEKIKIISIILISIVVSFFYIHQNPKFIIGSLKVRINELDKFKNYQKNLYNHLRISNKEVLNKIISEFEDKEELEFVLINNLKIDKNFSNINKNYQQSKLEHYKSLFNISSSDGIDKIYLNFSWVDNLQAINILNQTFKLIIKNFKKELLIDLEYLYKDDKLAEIKKDLKFTENLITQSLIAKHLNIAEPLVTNNSRANIHTVTFYDGYTVTFYDGYKAIDKHIEIIKDRNYDKIYDLNDFKKKTNQLIMDSDYDFFNYQFLEINLKSDINSRKIYILSIFFGFFLGVFYVVISNKYLLDRIINVKKTN